MPRVKPLIRPDPRAAAIREEIGALAGAMQISYAELAIRAKIDPSTFYRRLRDPGDFRERELWEIREVRRKWEGK